MGRGKSGKVSSTGGVRSAKQKSYSNILERARSNFERNPNNLMYGDLAANYEKVVDRASKINMNKSSFSGVDAVVAMDNLPLGSQVRISGNLNEGDYELRTIRARGMEPGQVWVQINAERPHSFGSGIGTVSSELGLVRGGRMENDKNKKIKVLKRSGR